MAIYSTLDKGVTLLVLRVVTITMFFLIPILGDKCCQLRNQLKLLRNQNVTITSMTGWIKGPSSVIAAFRMRKLPAGFFGLLMIFAAALALVTDLVSARFVTTEPWQTRCPFEQGMVSDGSAGVAQYPPFPSSAYTMASQAQQNSYSNGGIYGIYTKVSSSSWFSAEANDTIGRWHCSESGKPQNYSSAQFWDYNIADDLVNKSLIYPDWYPSNTSLTDPITQLRTNESWQLVIMSASAGQVGTPFTLKFAIDMEDILDPVTNKPMSKVMQGYYCELQANAGFETTVDTILKGINPRWLLTQWIEPIRGNLYDSYFDTTVGNETISWMVWVLNSAAMVAASMTRTTDSLNGSTYGCLISVTKLPNFVLALVVLSAAFFAALAITAIILLILVSVAGKKYDQQNNGSKLSSKELKESVPNGLVGWMVHAAQEANRAPERPDEKGLTKWRLTSRDFDNHRLRMVHANERAAETEHMMQNPQHGMQTNPNAYVHSQYSQNSSGFFAQKTGYSSVNTRDSP